MLWEMNNAENPILTGVQLVADFQATMVNLAGAKISAEEARQSENIAVSELQYFSRDTVLNPTFIPVESGSDIARTSIDAHIKKVQAEQIQRLSQDELAAMTTQDKERFTGRHVVVHVIDRPSKPIESIWFNSKRGYSNSTVDTNRIKGIVAEVWLEKNSILIKPTLKSRIIDPGRKNYIVYVINPSTMQPMVELEIS